MAARLARALLTLLLIGALALSGARLRALAQSPAGSVMVERSADGLRAATERALMRAAAEGAIEARLEALLSAEPRDWPAIEAVEAVAAERGIALPEALAARRTALHAADHGLAAAAGRCVACAWDPRACDLSAALLCGVGINLTPLGDVAALARAGLDHALGREVDEVDVILSAVGLAAVVLIPATGGTSATVKAGAGMVRTVWRMGRLAPALADVLRGAARQGLDWARLPAARSAGDVAAALRPAALAPAMDLARDAARMRAAGGIGPAVRLLSAATTPAEARRLANAAEALGPRSVGALEVLGRARLLRLTLRLADEVWWAVAGIFAALSALAGAAGAALGAALLRALRRTLRQAARGAARPRAAG